MFTILPYWTLLIDYTIFNNIRGWRKTSEMVAERWVYITRLKLLSCTKSISVWKISIIISSDFHGGEGSITIPLAY